MPIERVLVATDFGESSSTAVTLAADLSIVLKASLTLIHVVDYYPVVGYAFDVPVDILSEIESAGEAALAKEHTELMRRVPHARATLKRGVPYEAVLAFAKADATDLLVVGTHGHRGVKHVLLGSVAEKLVRLSACPVLTVRAGTGPR